VTTYFGEDILLEAYVYRTTRNFRHPRHDRSRLRGGTLVRMERDDASSGRSATLIARIEVAVGMLMEFRGWDPSTARAHLVLASVRADTPVDKVATVLVALYD
jgi:hypothetical protein